MRGFAGTSSSLGRRRTINSRLIFQESSLCYFRERLLALSLREILVYRRRLLRRALRTSPHASVWPMRRTSKRGLAVSSLVSQARAVFARVTVSSTLRFPGYLPVSCMRFHPSASTISALDRPCLIRRLLRLPQASITASAFRSHSQHIMCLLLILTTVSTGRTLLPSRQTPFSTTAIVCLTSITSCSLCSGRSVTIWFLPRATSAIRDTI